MQLEIKYNCMSSENEYEKTIERLTVLFSRGKISEEAYMKAIKTVEEELSKKRKETTVYSTPALNVCMKCGKEFLGRLKLCPYCGGESLPSSPTAQVPYPHYGKPTALWWLVPFFFSILGGIVAYVAVKDDDKGMAEGLLSLGFIMFFVDLFIVLLLL